MMDHPQRDFADLTRNVDDDCRLHRWSVLVATLALALAAADCCESECLLNDHPQMENAQRFDYSCCGGIDHSLPLQLSACRRIVLSVPGR